MEQLKRSHGLLINYLQFMAWKIVKLFLMEKQWPITEFFQRVKSKTVENRERAQTTSDVQRAMIAAVETKFQNSSNKAALFVFRNNISANP